MIPSSVSETSRCDVLTIPRPETPAVPAQARDEEARPGAPFDSGLRPGSGQSEIEAQPGVTRAPRAAASAARRGASSARTEPSAFPLEGPESTLQEVAAAIRGGTDFLVTSHLRPDGDNLGAATAVMLLLEKLGKPYRAVNCGPIPENLRFLPRLEAIEISPECGPPADVCIVLDTPTLARSGYDWRASWPARTVINIDHHPGNEMYGQLNLVDTSAPASCYLVYLLALELGVEIDPEMATSLFTGLMTDTGYFRFACVTPEIFRVAADLIARGAPHDRLYRSVYEEQPLAAARLQGEAVSRARQSRDDLIWIELTRELVARAGATETDASGIVGKLTTIRGIRIGITFEERGPGQTLVELRSVGDLNVGELARPFGGGGHRNAAGCCYPGPISEIRDALIPAAERLLASRS